MFVFQSLTISLGCHGLAILKFMLIRCSDKRNPSIKASESLKVKKKNNKINDMLTEKD